MRGSPVVRTWLTPEVKAWLRANISRFTLPEAAREVHERFGFRITAEQLKIANSRLKFGKANRQAPRAYTEEEMGFLRANLPVTPHPDVIAMFERRFTYAFFASVVSVVLVILFAGLVVGPLWIPVAYALGGVLAGAALRADRTSRAGGGPGSRLRRMAGRICGWGLRYAFIAAMVYAGFWVIVEVARIPGRLELLETLPDGPTTKAEVIAAMKAAYEEACRAAVEKAELAIVLVGVFGVAGSFLSGLRDWLLFGAVGARHGVSAWQVLGFGRSRHDCRAFHARERDRRRRLLMGEDAG